MPDLAALIHEAASTGRLTGLTIWPCAAGWQCNAQRRTLDGAEGWCCVTADDPVQGAMRALTEAFTSPARPAPVSEITNDGDIFG